MKKIYTCILAILISISVLAGTDLITINDSTITSMTRDEIRNLYLMRMRSTTEGHRVILFQYPNTSNMHINFVQDVLHMTALEYQREMDKITNNGSSNNNILVVKNKNDMLRRVSLTYNSIGYVDSLTLLVNYGAFDVKTIRIIE